MALQDDYWDLCEVLDKSGKVQLDRIWGAFCELDREVEKLRKIKSAVKEMIVLVFDTEV